MGRKPKPKVEMILPDPPISAKPERNKGGRPTEYRPEYCDKIIEFCSRGHTIEAFAGSIGVTSRAVFKWVDKYPEFAHAKELAKAKAQLALEQIGLDVMHGLIPAKDFNATVWIFWMKNCHGWRDRVDISGAVDVDFHSKLIQQIEASEKGNVIDVEEEKK